MRFDSYHPTINLIYFVAVIFFTVAFNHPVFVMIAYLSAFAYSIKLNGKKQVVFNAVLIPLVFAYTAWYAYYNHFGITNLYSNFIDNKITLESLLYGLQLSITVATLLMIFSCLFFFCNFINGQNYLSFRESISEIFIVYFDSFEDCAESKTSSEKNKYFPKRYRKRTSSKKISNIYN